LRAAVYEKYVGGFWRLPANPMKKLYPAYYQVDYPVFEKVDSATRAAGIKQVWVQSAIDNFGFLFAPEGAMGVSVKNADSLDYYQTDIVAGTGGKQKDWYYFVRSTPNGFVPEISLFPADSSSLQLITKQIPFVDSVANEMGIPLRDSAESEAEYVKRSLYTIRDYFVQNFKYSLVIPKMSEHRNEPLRAFWLSREGFCSLYASMSVLVLRHRGIHARYVSGFAHPERVPGRDYVLYRRHHSHAWVEVFVDGRWYSFDPTPPSLRKIFASPSGWQSWWEGVRGRLAHWFHLLKEGQWRSVVDSWQSFTQNALENPWTYVVPGLIVLALLAFRGLRRFKGRSTEAPDARALEWARKLERTEKSLKRLGYVRKPGETVGHFLVRLEQRMGSDGVEATRLSPLVNVLRDYESKRWR
jgi:transglutaminase-like putative cysteine protease